MAARRRKSKKSGRSAVKRPRSKRKAARARPKRKAAGTRRQPKRRQPKRRPPAQAARAPAPPAARTPRRSALGAAARERLAAGVPVEVGVVVHWFPRASAALVALSRPIHLGDVVHVRGQSTDFVQEIASLALEGAPVRAGAAPQVLGVRLAARARPGDRVYRVSW
jgi:hypothetical protein